MAQAVVGQRLRQLFAEFGCECVSHREPTEGVQDGRDVRLLEPDIGVPGQAWLFELFCLVFLEHAAV